jgi:uncharacterized protein (DUF1786 family)
MQILTVDIGTGTQDIYLFDSRLDIENGFKLVLPSPTMIVHQRLKQATRRGEAVLLSGVIMGGGPSQWAAEAHIRAGYRLYATPEAARSFNDDLEVVRGMGIEIVSEDEAKRLPDSVKNIEMRDFDFASIASVFGNFGVSLSRLRAVSVAVFDHGNAPPNISDRQFRFDYLDRRIRETNRLSAFAYRSEEIPAIMTRLRAVADSAGKLDTPLVVMDTAPAAVLGGTFDPWVASQGRVILVNVGNFHTLAFRLRASEGGKHSIEGVFEHHTGLLGLAKLEKLLLALADGSLTNQEVFEDHGHGALIYDPTPFPMGGGELKVCITGPRRNIFKNTSYPTASSELKRSPRSQRSLATRDQIRVRPYFAVPFGDMMLAGCFGLLAATADLYPDLGAPILSALRGSGENSRAPWDAE